MADYLRIDVKTFRRRYTKKVMGTPSLGENKTSRGYDCVFLRFDDQGKALCAVYPVRPQQCRTWPFWPDNVASREDFESLAVSCKGVAAGMKGKGELYPAERIRIIRDGRGEVGSG